MRSIVWNDPATQELLDKAQIADESSLSIADLAQLLKAEQTKVQRGFMTSLRTGDRMTQTMLERGLADTPAHKRFYSYVWNDSAKNLLALSAVGLDSNPYFANSFLVGFVPFELNNAWQPLALLSMRKTYMFDHDQYGAQYEDVWQNSQQAYIHSHGDCEDHAILLADWLIGLGYDARVAVGEVAEGGGHAWVVLLLEQNTYILEATSKRAPKSVNDFLLADRAITYYPEIQFNREQIWENTGSNLTTRYTDEKWVERAHFTSIRRASDTRN